VPRADARVGGVRRVGVRRVRLFSLVFVLSLDGAARHARSQRRERVDSRRRQRVAKGSTLWEVGAVEDGAVTEIRRRRVRRGASISKDFDRFRSRLGPHPRVVQGEDVSLDDGHVPRDVHFLYAPGVARGYAARRGGGAGKALLVEEAARGGTAELDAENAVPARREP